MFDLDIQLFFNIINSYNYNFYLYTTYLKILLNNLPTMQNLNLWYPYLYLTTNCASCKQTEDILHLFNCPSVKTPLINSICKIITQTKQELQIENISANILIKNLIKPPFQLFFFILLLILGTIPQNIFQPLKQLLTKYTTNFFIKLSNNLLDWFIKEIWTPRNIIQYNWESAWKINYKTRNKKIYFSQSTINTTQQLSQSNYDINPYILKWYSQNYNILSIFH